MTAYDKERAKALRQYKKDVFRALSGKSEYPDPKEAEAAERWLFEEGLKPIGDDDYRAILLADLEWAMLYGAGPRHRATAMIESALLALTPSAAIADPSDALRLSDCPRQLN